MLGQRHEIARLQSDFYRYKLQRILRWLLVTTLIMLGLIITIIYLIFFKPQSQYYANTTNGRILNMPVPRYS